MAAEVTTGPHLPNAAPSESGFQRFLKRISNFGVVVLVGGGMTFIQVDEYALAVLSWIAATAVLVSKVIHWQPSRPMSVWSIKARRAIYLFGALSFLPVSVLWTQAKRGDKSWTSFFQPRTVSATLDFVLYTNAANIDVRYDLSNPMTQLWMTSDKTLYTINSAIYVTLSNLSEKPLRISYVSVETNCGSAWTKMDRVAPAAAKLVTHADDGSPLKASVLEYKDFTDSLAAGPIVSGGSASGMMLMAYPENFSCDSRNPSYRFRFTDIAGHRNVLDLRGGAGQEKYDRVGYWNRLVTFTGETIDVSGFTLDRY